MVNLVPRKMDPDELANWAKNERRDAKHQRRVQQPSNRWSIEIPSSNQYEIKGFKRWELESPSGNSCFRGPTDDEPGGESTCKR